MFEQCIRKLTLATFGAVVSLALLSFSGDQAGAAGLLSPADGSKPALQIKDHSVTVVIEAGYALTTVEQIFHNPHGVEFEAIYSFPVPEKAAVAEFTYWIDGKPVSGEVLPKKQARQVYEEEKAAGHEAGLTEQDSYKTFDISVWPVEPGKDTRIRLTYIQPAHVDTGVGRYVYPLEEGGVDEEKLSFWTANENVTGRFSFDLILRSAYAVTAVRLPSHPAAVVAESATGEWRIHMDNGTSALVDEEGTATPAPSGESFRLDTDVVVYWRHQTGLPGSIDLVPYKEASDSRGAFMLVLTPGDDLKPITEGRDWIFVLDISGSMRAKYHTLVEGVAKGLNKFRSEDRFRLIVFNKQAMEVGAGFVNATPENINQAIAAIRTITPGGSTNLYAGLKKGLEGLDSDRSSGIVLVTDGVANVGVTEKRSFLKLVKKQDVRLYTMVMGNSANRPLLEAISKESGGTAVNVSNSDDIIGAVLSATSKLSHEAMHDVKVTIKGLRTADIAPKRIGSLYRGQQLVLFGHYWGEGEVDVRLTAKVSGKPVTYDARFVFPDIATLNPEIKRLWSYAAIEDLMQEMDITGEDADTEQAITDLAVEGGLVTPYTSMVVVREEVYVARGIARDNAQRIEKEQQAQAQRKSQPVQSHRVDQTATAFNSPQPSYGGSSSGSSSGGSGNGSGALGPFGAIIMLSFAAMVILLRCRQARDSA